jgi:hypothetical protein
MSRVYIHEIVDGVTGRSGSPADRSGGARRCFGSFAVVAATGRWPTAIEIWEHDSWSDLAADLSEGIAGSSDEPVGETPRGVGRILVSHDASPGAEDWARRGGTGAVAYVHEVIDGPPGSAAEVCEAIVGDGAQDHRRFGLELVGAWRTAMRADDQVVALWSLPDLETWAAYETAADGGDVEFFHLWQRLSGQVHRRRRTLLVDAEGSPLRSA